jgi:hypothetical protein
MTDHDLDLTRLEPAGSRARAAQTPAEDVEAYLLRLCLDLQLDALLLTLGAAAAAECTRRTSATPSGSTSDSATDTPPWRRWAEEDVDLACALAADALEGGSALPAGLGSDLHRSVPAIMVDTLIALYESMTSGLADLAQTRSTGHPGVDEALDRGRHRLAELQRHRLTATPPRGVTLPQAERHYCRGELLG